MSKLRYPLGIGFFAVPWLSALALGCGGIGAGDYVVYRVAGAESSLSGDCSNDDGDSTTLREGGSLVLYIAGGEQDLPLLDFGGRVLEGGETEGGYEFSGATVDREAFGGNTIFDSDHDGIDDGDDPLVDSDADGIEDFNDPDVDVDADGLDDIFEDDIVDANNDGEDDRIVTLDGDTLVTTLSITVALVIDGQNVSGTATTKSSLACEGTCTGFDASTCTSTQAFVGVEIEEALLEVPN